jgi:hypothetical protein
VERVAQLLHPFPVAVVVAVRGRRINSDVRKTYPGKSGAKNITLVLW